ncbi:hypothetical protein K410107C12_26280 [Agathobacter rectalis]
MFLLYHAYIYLELLILTCTIYILAPGYTLVISLMYLGEAILFLMPYENYIVDIMCTLFGIVLILCLILRYKSRKG